MEFKNKFLKVFQDFVPEGYQGNAKHFMYYLKTMTEKRHDRRMTALEVSSASVKVLIYNQQNTETEIFKWSDLEKLIIAEYKLHFPIVYQQMSVELW